MDSMSMTTMCRLRKPSGARGALLVAILALTGLLPSTPARAQPSSDDTVFLKDGGRIRGTIVEEGPAGVRIRIATGETRQVPPEQVDRVAYAQSAAPVPPAPSPPAAATPPVPADPTTKGQITLSVDAAAEVFLAGGSVGTASPGKPLRLELPEGAYRLVVRFEGGVEEEAAVTVLGARALDVSVGNPVTAAQRARQDLHLALQVGLGGGADGGEESGMLRAFLGLGPVISLGRFVTLRPSGMFWYGLAPSSKITSVRSDDYSRESLLVQHFALQVGGEIRFHPVDVYSLGLGTYGGPGLYVSGDGVAPTVFIGPRITPAAFHFGPQGEWEVGAALTIDGILVTRNNPMVSGQAFLGRSFF